MATKTLSKPHYTIIELCPNYRINVPNATGRIICHASFRRPTLLADDLEKQRYIQVHRIWNTNNMLGFIELTVADGCLPLLLEDLQKMVPKYFAK